MTIRRLVVVHQAEMAWVIEVPVESAFQPDCNAHDHAAGLRGGMSKCKSASDHTCRLRYLSRVA
ncbi:hypothetical protein EJ03DRAFT_324991 [Teratosphaeria nubilosa]|uniref:Uncharacterized protein n=1 Tax=Teratosphaeria nubilosa TaxID=161662 RepID=A0A6G1LIA2_9PEZI|nr:hypothetical protein EJ03DRAFT_324991 [Teratosphaeria nubilosa]